jgi:hypothetical protein
MFACLIIHTFQLIFQPKLYTANHRTMLLVMTFQRSKRDLYFPPPERIISFGPKLLLWIWAERAWSKKICAEPAGPSNSRRCCSCLFGPCWMPLDCMHELRCLGTEWKKKVWGAKGPAQQECFSLLRSVPRHEWCLSVPVARACRVSQMPVADWLLLLNHTTHSAWASTFMAMTNE